MLRVLYFVAHVMYRLPHIQNAIKQLLTLILSGTYLSNRGKISYPFFPAVHRKSQKEILNLEKLLCVNCNVKSTKSPYKVLANSIKWFNSRINCEAPDLKRVKLNIPKTYDRSVYHGLKFDPINRLCEYIKEKMEPYLIGAYIHGSLSTMDYTGYSDLDTLFIIKQEVLEAPDKIKELERLFIKSMKYLYEFDPLQHHGHFFLTESDLKYYDQAILPLSAIRLSTSILGRGNSLTFYVRDSKQESEIRFIDSIKTVRHYITKDTNRLSTPYYLKGFLSHFMILPVLFLQLRGEYVSKKDSFEILNERVPPGVWRCMEQVSEIRWNWDQTASAFRCRLMKIVGMWNPLLLHFFSVHFYKCYPLSSELPNACLLGEMYAFTEYLVKLDGLNEDRLEDRQS